MAVDWTTHLDSIYAALGVSAELTPASEDADTYDLTLVDATLRIEPDGFNVKVPTIVPGVCVRLSELEDNSLNRAALAGASLVWRAVTWRVDNTEPRPGGDGPGTGEIFLLLAKP